MYSSTVTAVGALVADFREQGLLVWFGENAPEELHEFSILHKVDNHKRAPIVGDTIAINDDHFTVLAVGDVASKHRRRITH